MRLTYAVSVAAALLSLAACGDETDVSWDLELVEAAFVRADAAAESPSGHTVLDHCADSGETWPDAAATITVRQNAQRSEVVVTMTDARPNTIYTAWLRLKGKDPATGDTYGGNPITGAGSTPLAHTDYLPELVATSEIVGAPTSANSLTTDADGNGAMTLDLDFPVIDGAYPFDRYDSTLTPVNTVKAPFAAFLVRLASHCTDDLTHGLKQGDREMWFNWSP